MRAREFLLTLTIVALVALQPGRALKCYVCDSPIDGNCNNPQQTETCTAPASSTSAPGSTASTSAPGSTASTSAPGSTASTTPSGTPALPDPTESSTSTSTSTITALPDSTESSTSTSTSTTTALPDSADSSTSTSTSTTTVLPDSADSSTSTSTSTTTVLPAPADSSAPASTSDNSESSSAPGGGSRRARSVINRFSRIDLRAEPEVCLKILYKINETDHVKRGCSNKLLAECKDDATCFKCSEDSCNGSTINGVFTSMILSVAVVVFFMK